MLFSLCMFHKASTQVFNIYRKLCQKSPQELYIHILSCPSVIFVASYMEQDWTCMCWVQHSPYRLEALHILYVYGAFSTAVNSNWILFNAYDIWWGKDLLKKISSPVDPTVIQQLTMQGQDNAVIRLSILSLSILRFLSSKSTQGRDNCLSTTVYKWTPAFLLISRK